jgi:hypothetical protein
MVPTPGSAKRDIAEEKQKKRYLRRSVESAGKKGEPEMKYFPQLSYPEEKMIRQACYHELETLINCLKEGPFPYSEHEFGDTAYNEELWKPTIRYWNGRAKALIEAIHHFGGVVALEDINLTNNLEQYYGPGYVPCGGCGKWHAPEAMLLTYQDKKSRETLHLCLGCEAMASCT